MTHRTSVPQPRSRAVQGASLAVLLALTAAGCRVGDETRQVDAEPTPPASTAPSPTQLRASVPIDGYQQVDSAALEAGRRDAAWRTGAEWDRQQRSRGPWMGAGQQGGASGPPAPGAGAAGATPSAQAPIERLRQAGEGTGAPAAAPAPTAAPGASASRSGETYESLSPEALRSFQPRFPLSEDGGATVLAVQQLLDRAGFSPGVIDGRWGKNSEKAVYWLQDALGLEPTGTVDRALFDRLRQAAGTPRPVTTYRVTAEDVTGPFPQIPEDYGDQADLDCLCYTSPAEALAERFHTTPELLAKLNPQVDLERPSEGAELLVPDVEPFRMERNAPADETLEAPREGSGIAAVVVSKSGFYVQAVDAQGRVLYHFPTTVGAGYDASPSGDLKVTATVLRPTFHYQPTLFADVPDEEPEALLPAGPNSPVGVVWMQLSKENYGIHGTSEPSTIGYTTSHGCVRLTNWDARFLAERLPAGTPVLFRGEHPSDAERQAASDGAGEGAAAAGTPAPSR